MKKLLFTFLIPALLCSAFAFGQNPKKDLYVVYGGVTFNKLSVDASQYESQSQVGYALGVSYRRGAFFYWQLGLRYNSPLYHLKPVGISADSTHFNFSVRDLDVPINFGINILSATGRVLGLRAFIGIVPAFTLSVNDNHLGITKDKVNSFNTYGQIGIGGDVAFLILDTGVNYGFSDVLKNGKSKPTQFFINLGFRF